MKKIFIIAIVGILLIGSQAAIGSNIINTQNKTGFDWVMILYLNGDNALSAAQAAVMESIRQVGSTSQVMYAILIDQNKNNDTRLYYLNGTNLVQQDWEIESAMDDPTTLVNLVTKVKTDLIAIHYALILSSNKGSGWQGVCWDDHGDGIMITMPELSQAFDEITNGGETKLDILGIETCMTGNLEVAYQISPFVNYFVAYPECSMAGDWPYVASFTDLNANPAYTPEEFAIDIVSHFVPQSYPQYDMITTMAAINLSYLGDLGMKFNNQGQFFIDNMSEYKSQITSALEAARVYALSWDIDYYIDFYDFLDLCTITDPDFISIKTDIQSIMDLAVIANAHLPSDPAHGLSIYFPRRATDYNDSLRYEELPSPYESTTFANMTQWDEFLKTYLGIFGNTPPSTPTIAGPAKGKPGIEYIYTFNSVDSEGNDIFYFVDWGDGTTSGWQGPYASGTDLELNHTWSKKGTYTMRVKAKDVLAAESDWETLSVRMPRIALFNGTRTLLIGRITGLEKNEQGGFRFSPIRVLYISHTSGQLPVIKMLDAVDGEYPCCSYIPKSEFRGKVKNNFVIGAWITPS